MIGLQDFSRRSLVGTLAAGFVAGVLQLAVYWGLLWAATQANDGLVESYVPLTLMVVAIVFAHFIGLVGLIRLQVLRPLLAVLAAIATTWGVWNWVEVMPWWGELVAIGLLMAVAYSFFAWVNRLLSFPLALVVIVVSVVLARLAFINI